MRKSRAFVIGILVALALATLPTTKAQDIGVSYQIVWQRDIPYINMVDITPDGSRIVAADDTLYFLDKDGNILWTKQDYDLGGYIMGIAVTPDGQHVLYATGFDYPAGPRGTIGSLDEYGNEEWKHKPEGWALDVDTDGYNVVAIDEEGTLYSFNVYGDFYWEYSLNKNLTKISLGNNNGNYVAVLWGDYEVCLVTPETVDCDTIPEMSTIAALDISPDGKYVALSVNEDAGSWLLVEYLSGADIYTKTLDSKISDAKFSPDGNYIAVVSANKVYLYDINGNLLWQQQLPENTRSVAVSQNAEYIVVSTDSSLYMFRKVEFKEETVYLDIGDKVVVGGTIIKVVNISVNDNSATFYITLPDGTTRKVVLNARESLSEKITQQLDFDLTVNGVLIGIEGGLSVEARFKLPEGEELSIIRVATLEIYSTPTGAEVYINGDYQGTTPLILELPPGNYTLRLIKEDYEDQITKVELKSGETTSTWVYLTPKSGYLTVYSSPSGAEVYVDGDYVGTTPLEDYKLSTGEHSVVVKKNDYQDYKTTVTIEPGKTEKLETTLSKEPGTLKITSEPSGAKVYIGGDYKGTTPLTLKLSPGTYSIKLTKDGYEDYTASITLSAGETKSISATLKLAYGFLNVDSDPSGAKVYVDGK